MCELWRGLVLYSNPLAFGHGENMSHQPLNELQAELALCHMRSDRLKCGNIQPPWQALRETPAHGFIHRQKACCETTITCPPLCVRVKENKTCAKCFHSPTARATKDHTYGCTGNVHNRILDMLRKCSSVVSEQVSQWDDAERPQWRVSLLLSAWNTNLSLKYGNKNLYSSFSAFPTSPPSE